MLTGADMVSRPVAAVGLDARGVLLGGADGSSTERIAWDQVLSLERTAPGRSPKSVWALLLRDNEQIAGEPLELNGQTFRWQNALIGELPISPRRIAAIVRSGMPAPDVDLHRGDDLVTLTNGDTVAGIVVGLTPEMVLVQRGDATVKPAMETVRSILFATAPGSTTAAVEGRAFRVGLTDGSSLRAESLKWSGQTMRLTLPGGEGYDLDISAVEQIEQLNGPVLWLSSRVPAESVQTPWFSSIAWPAKVDRSVSGRAIRADGRTVRHGIGVHAYSRLSWNIEPGWKAFGTQYAVEDRSLALADMTVRIKLDGKVVHEQAHVKADGVYPPVVVRLDGATKLTLEVDYGQGNDTQDRLNWIAPALLRKMPASSPATRPTTR